MMRKAHERISDYSSRFRTAVADLKAEGVVLPDPEVGWFYKEKLGLDGLRKQLLETALAGAEDYHQIEAECLRLFRGLHTQDPLFRRADRASGRLTIRRILRAVVLRCLRRPPRQACTLFPPSAIRLRIWTCTPQTLY